VRLDARSSSLKDPQIVPEWRHVKLIPLCAQSEFTRSRCLAASQSQLHEAAPGPEITWSLALRYFYCSPIAIVMNLYLRGNVSGQSLPDSAPPGGSPSQKARARSGVRLRGLFDRDNTPDACRNELAGRLGRTSHSAASRTVAIDDLVPTS